MQNHTTLFASFVVLCATAALPTMTVAQSNSAVEPGQVVATVNNRPITKLSIDNVAEQITDSGEEADPELILNELINLELLTQAAEKLELDKQAEIAATLQLQYTQTMANAYLARKGSEMQFTDEELRAEYDAQAANVARDEYRASHIMLETQEQANRVLSEIASGKTFADAAADYSIDASGSSGGDLGWLTASTMDPSFVEPLNDLEVGGITRAAVQSEFGFHIIKLVDLRSAALPDFQSVKTGLTNLAVRRALAEHVDQLKSDAEIVINQ